MESRLLAPRTRMPTAMTTWRLILPALRYLSALESLVTLPRSPMSLMHSNVWPVRRVALFNSKLTDFSTPAEQSRRRRTKSLLGAPTTFRTLLATSPSSLINSPRRDSDLYRGSYSSSRRSCFRKKTASSTTTCLNIESPHFHYGLPKRIQFVR